MDIVAAYIRVSTEDQLEYSPDSQLKAIREYVKRNNMILPEEYIFIDEGISGRNAEKRPAFMKMIGTAKSKPTPFNSILVWKFSRFARNREDSIVYKSMLRKQCNIDVLSISEQLGEDKTSILIEALLEAMDEYYSINLAEEVRRGMTEKANRGEVVSSPPFGYDVENNIFVPNSNASPIVQMIFEDYLNGLGIREIAIKLNDLGILTRYGNRWENRTVEYVLRNVVYTGKLTWTPNKKKGRNYDNPDTIISTGKHEPIIDSVIFDKVQEKIDENKKRYPKYARTAPSEYMLKGFVRCSNCGATLTQASRGKGLQCHNYAKGKCEVSHYISLNIINDLVIDNIKKDIEKNEFNIVIVQNKVSSDNEVTQKLIDKENLKLKRIKQAYEAGIDTIEEYKESKLKILNRVSELEKKLVVKELTKEEINKKLSGKIKKSFSILLDDTASQTVKNSVLRKLVREIIYNRKSDTVEIHYQL